MFDWPGLPRCTLGPPTITPIIGGRRSFEHMVKISITVIKNTSAKENRGGKKTTRNVNETKFEGYCNLVMSDLRIRLFLSFRICVPVRNRYWMTSEQSCTKELFYALIEGSRRLEPLQENILQSGQSFCRSSTDNFLQGRRNTRYKFL